jgi:polyketide cyclase/dehydrase/lipid transport protein
MARRGLLLVLMLSAGRCALAAEPNLPGQTNDDWKLASKSGGVMLYSRTRPGSSLKEFKAVGEIDASTRTVHNVLDDFEQYPKFMPFTAECRLLKREGDAMIGYQRLSPKIVGDRDYTLRIRQKSWPAEGGGLVYQDRWEPANELGPAEKPGVLRVKLCEGGWLLEPASANKTRATYSIYTDSGGKLPAFIANAASEIGIRKIFTAVRKQVKNPRYAAE